MSAAVAAAVAASYVFLNKRNIENNKTIENKIDKISLQDKIMERFLNKIQQEELTIEDLENIEKELDIEND